VPFEPVADSSGDGPGIAAAYDDLAQHFEDHVDMDAILVWFEDGKQ
jgi:adenosylcobyric acid synthase